MEKQYVIFNLGEEKYGINIINIQEICRYQKITNLPNTPEFIKGIINYRDKVIPVIDLNKKFKLNYINNITDNTRIIIIIINGKQIGLIVDEVSNTTKIDDSSIEDIPSNIINAPEIDKIAKLSDKLISIIDIKKMFSISK